MISASVYDRLRMLRKLTPARLWNILKVYTGFYWSRLSKSPVHWGLPYSISIEPTTSCNLRCPECPSGLRSFTRKTGMLNPDFFKKNMDELASYIHYITFYFQGEPFLNRNFLEMIRYSADRNIYTATSTNAHYLDDATAKKTVESGLDRLIISIDGTTQEVYEQYRIGGKLEKVLEGTRNIIRWKKELNSKTPYVIFQFLVVKPNEHQIPEILKLAEEMEVDEVKLKTAQVYDYENGNPLIPENDRYSRYRKTTEGKYVLKNKLDNHCWRMWSGCVITWDGKVVPCCFDKDAAHQLGDLSDSSLKAIWNNKSYKEFRSQIISNRKNIDICANCSEGTKVWT